MKNRPTEPGPYWAVLVKNGSAGPVNVVEVTEDCVSFKLFGYLGRYLDTEFKDLEWLGPAIPPKESSIKITICPKEETNRMRRSFPYEKPSKISID